MYVYTCTYIYKYVYIFTQRERAISIYVYLPSAYSNAHLFLHSSVGSLQHCCGVSKRLRNHSLAGCLNRLESVQHLFRAVYMMWLFARTQRSEVSHEGVHLIRSRAVSFHQRLVHACSGLGERVSE